MELGDDRRPGQSFHWRTAYLTLDVGLTDDPLLSQTSAARLKNGEEVNYLARMGAWAYVEATVNGELMCGFVPYNALEMSEVDLNYHPACFYAADFLDRAGIAAAPTGIDPHKREIFFDLAAGGTFWAYWYGQAWDEALTPLEFNWRFENATDGDIAKYLDAALSLLAEVENGSIDGARNWSDVAQARETYVSNGLLYQEYLGQQALRVLLSQLAAHDGNDALNSLRARLASKLLGIRDKTATDPAEGCAWYDALRLAEQNDLPPVDPALYVSDPALLAATRLLLEKAEAEYADYPSDPETDVSKCAVIVSLGECAREEAGDTVTLWVSMGRVMIAVYDGADYRLASGSWYPIRVTLQNRSGEWALAEVAEPEDGDDYWPAIVKMCNGDEALANRLCETDSGARAATRAYLEACGYPEAAAKVGE
ncbi:MAG: hypothetical protein IJS53_00165 [Clostridia bacterium]|nr:hypothetical protein [Clostridia bacterium]